MFRFRYDFGELTYQNLGIAGPLTHAFAADLQDLSINDVYAAFVKHVGHYPNLKILRMPSVEAAQQFANKSVDMVFIDAGHDVKSVTEDFAAWIPKCRVLFCGHDFGHVPVSEALMKLGKRIDHHPSDIWSFRCDD